VDGAGRMLATSDGGRRWSFLPALPARASGGIDFVDARHGWLLAGSLYRTDDGGKSWTRLPFHCGENQMIGRLSFVGRYTGFLLCAVMNGPFAVSLYRSDDSGASWHEVSVVDQMAHDMGAFEFISTRVGFVSAGFGNLLRTDDGGRTFHQVPGTPFESVQAASWFGHTGYVATFSVLMKTLDAGAQWQQLYPAIMPQGPILLTASGAGVGVGMDWSPDGSAAAILRTGNGIHWRRVARLPGVTSIDGLVQTSARTVWAVAHLAYMTVPNEALFRSTDGGANWRRILTVRPANACLSFVGSRLGFLALADTRDLYVTRDGGSTWSRRTESTSTWNDQFVSALSGWAFGEGSRVLHTDDGGRHWQPVDVQVAGLQPAALYFVNPSDGWITGTLCNSTPCSAVSLRTRDGGAHWVLIRFHQPFAFDGFDWVTPQLGYVMLNGALFRTRDGGVTWRVVKG
jgi:photosystem II stability/assembly factor-like uncharacterized protein